MALWSTKLCSSTLTSHQRGRVQQHFAPLVFRLASTGNLHPARPTAVYSASASLARAPQQFSIPAPPKMEWQSLAASSAELTLDFTLPTGQSFRWRRTGKAEFTGVVDNRVVSDCEQPTQIYQLTWQTWLSSITVLRLAIACQCRLLFDHSLNFSADCCRSRCNSSQMTCSIRSLRVVMTLMSWKMQPS